VIAWGEGSVPELIDDGLSGIVVFSLEQAVEAVHQVRYMDRSVVRARFEARFTASHMAAKYVQTFQTLLHAQSKPSYPRFCSPPQGAGRAKHDLGQDSSLSRSQPRRERLTEIQLPHEEEDSDPNVRST
jgi:hypothetical protein